MIQSYTKIWALFTGAERWRFVAVMGLTLIMAVMELITVAGILPLLSVLANPELIETQPLLIWFTAAFDLEGVREVALTMGVIILGVVLVGMAVRAAVTYVQIRFALGRAYSISSRLLHRHLGQDYSFYLGRNTATLSQSLLSEVDLVIRESILPAVLLISNTAILVLVGGFLFWSEPVVALIAMVTLVGVYVIAFLVLKRRISAAGQARMVANKGRFTVLQEVTGSLKDIKVSGLERTSLQRFRAPARELVRYQTIGLILQRLPRFALEAIVYGGFVAMILILVVIRGQDIADLLPLLGLLAVSATKLFPALQQIYQQASMLRMSEAALERLHNDLQLDDDLPALPPREGSVLSLNTDLVFKNVSLRYPQAEAASISDLDLRIEARTSIGIVGGTGAGKTTLADLILGLLHPDTGQIEVDGTVLTRERIRDWQRNIGYVPQAIFLSDDTVAANIAFGLPPEQIDMDQVRKVARLASLHDFVENELPDGYQTSVGERGLRLSGGQRQRIGIARALYRNPNVLLLDEATSALDTVTEQAVMQAVRDLGGQKTIIMIAHRLTTIMACDKILLMERGRLIEEGTYEELIAKNETFRQLARLSE